MHRLVHRCSILVATCVAAYACGSFGADGGGATGAEAGADAGIDVSAEGAAGDGSAADGGAYAGEVSLDRPVAHWRLGDAVTPAAYDELGASPGAYHGNVTLRAPGALVGDPDTAASFDGTTAYVSVAAGDKLEFPGNATFTIEAWARPTTIVGQIRAIVGKEVTGGIPDGYLLFAESAAGLVFTRSLDGGNADYLKHAAGLPLDAWSHVVVTNDGVSLRLYLNADLKTTVASKVASAAPGTFLIGGRRSGVASFAGVIDEVAVYATALSSERIQAHYAAGAKR